jgi:hypothetical protein
MNPLEFSWKEEQQVTVKNPTAVDFDFKVHNKDYRIGAGQTAKMPGYMAWLYVYNMAAKLAQDAGEYLRWNEEGFRTEYYNKVVVGADALVEIVQVEVEPEIVTFDTVDEKTLPAETTSSNSGIASMKPDAKATSGKPARV